MIDPEKILREIKNRQPSENLNERMEELWADSEPSHSTFPTLRSGNSISGATVAYVALALVVGVMVGRYTMTLESKGNKLANSQTVDQPTNALISKLDRGTDKLSQDKDVSNQAFANQRSANQLAANQDSATTGSDDNADDNDVAKWKSRPKRINAEELLSLQRNSKPIQTGRENLRTLEPAMLDVRSTILIQQLEYN